MRNPAVRHSLLAWSLVLLASFASLASAQPGNTLEALQVQACRATSSLLLYRGEGFQSQHLERMNNDLATLAATLQGPQVTDEMRQAHRELAAELRRGAAFGQNEEDVPWDYTHSLSKALRDFLAVVSQQADSAPLEQIPVQIEYLAVQYLFRAYIGTFEIAREDGEHYLGQDERKLVPSIDSEFSQLSVQNPAELDKLMTRWQYLKVALSDLNSGTTAMISSSGRPFAPTMVDRHTRSLTGQLLSLN
ncbi:hypothetical protein [Zestomonas carbonaria]|uniref:Type IV pili methyl-accepting chemotaxis transducer N-term n=1 Tax=Zestomonas carbonaria TaxID=2762745 RepID=A0A7U7I7V4_9GAMM|nr:hypothetical protein [Pseudomonas carbonaria]CAD5106644.1 hypothetical protein PSEWESI4_00911 [Pseudomonas carbonaria]